MITFELYNFVETIDTELDQKLFGSQKNLIQLNQKYDVNFSYNQPFLIFEGVHNLVEGIF